MPLVLSVMADATSGGPLSIDLDGIVPDRLTGLSLDAIGRLPIRADERPCVLGEILKAAGDPSDGVIECRGDFGRVHRLAAGMACGTMRVAGDVGRHAGEGMTGGRLEVAGNAGDWLACEMTAGHVVVHGSAGDNVGGALPGSDHGLRGGAVIVQGDVGQLVGQRMRRGIVAVRGNCGEGAAFEMRAGTVVVAGRVGPHPGLGICRGSLVSLTHQPDVPATFQRGRAWTPPFLGVLLASLGRAGFSPAFPRPSCWRQWHGDLLAGGRGEILCPETA